MKILIYILMAVIGGVIVTNAFRLDFTNVFQGDSSIALISILSGFCAFLLLSILLVSMKIAAKSKK